MFASPSSYPTCSSSDTGVQASDVNTALTEGYDMLGRMVDDVASHEMDIVKPSISIVKTSDADPAGVPVGTEVTYSFLVKNTGEEPLSNIFVTDDKLGAINSEPFSLLAGRSGCSRRAPCSASR